MVFLFDIIFERSLLWIPVCLAGGFLFSYLLYYFRNNDELKSKLRFILFLFRGILLTILLLYFINPYIKSASESLEKPHLLLMIDHSGSILSQKDSAITKEQIIKLHQSVHSELEDKYEIQDYSFADNLQNNCDFSFKGKISDLSGAINKVKNNYANSNVGAIVFISDGIYNRGSFPLQASQNLNSRVYSIGVGDTNQFNDYNLRKINHNQVAYLGNQFPAEITVSAIGFERKENILKIYQDGKVIQERKILFRNKYETQTINFFFQANQTGVIKYEAVITPVEEEKNKNNNKLSFYIEVIDSREKIALIYDKPHPDINAIRESILSNANYELKVFSTEQFKSEASAFGLIIFHGVDFSQNINMKKIIENGKTPFFIIQTQKIDPISGLNLKSNNGRFNDCEALPNSSFALFSISNELRNAISTWPAIRCPFGNIEWKNNFNSLLKQKIGAIESEQPILGFLQDENNRKSAVFIGDGLWRWRLRDYADNESHDRFNELIYKSIQFLSVKEDKSNFRVKGKNIVDENELIEFNAESYNNSYQLINEQDVIMQIEGSDDKKYDYTFSKSGNAYQLNAGSLAAGEYRWTARTNINGKNVERKGKFTVRKLESELTQTVADHQVLKQMAWQSKGEFYLLKNYNSLIEKLKQDNNAKTIAYQKIKLQELIEIKSFFFIILLLFGLEWFLRKRNGLI